MKAPCKHSGPQTYFSCEAAIASQLLALWTRSSKITLPDDTASQYAVAGSLQGLALGVTFMYHMLFDSFRMSFSYLSYIDSGIDRKL